MATEVQQSVIHEFETFFRILFPGYEVPSNQQWKRWFSLHKPEVVEYALREAAKKALYLDWGFRGMVISDSWRS